ncbi:MULTISPECIES: nitrate- and nitrite sensing domain-containing protein [unclassified Streptomyces]|uniref:nitrate- and nitrite sensing domain-containing protein n=1 Tax=unclassified Streptomyces TaxID=2593676 RepID=UPI002E15AFA1|nr:nitrate- and nitrite sensing domain-containing protein [Streptomyces sp. NBC_01197]WSS47935.1 nitrate- and nitrite sensing domain-containing protein [Streptomyces sp. NBC_01180]
MRFRGKSIRRKIVALLLVPLVALTAIWTFSVYLTGRDALQLMRTGTVHKSVAHPLVVALGSVEEERSLTLRQLVDPGASDTQSQLRTQRADTDAAVAQLRSSSARSDARSAMGAHSERQLRNVLDGFAGLGSLRHNTGDHEVTRREAYDQYNRLCDQALDFLADLPTLQNSGLDKEARGLVGVSRARESLSREDALLGSALTSGRLDSSDLRDISDLVTAREVYYTDSLPSLPGRAGDAYREYWSGPATIPVRTAESTVLGKSPGSSSITGSASRWTTDADRTLSHLDTLGTEARKDFQNRVRPAAVGVFAKAGIAALLGVGGLLVSLVVSVRIGRELIRDLSRLRKEAHEVSGVRLPAVMRRLAAGEQVDIETEAPRLEYAKDEVGQVGLALNTVQRAAVEAAVRQADLRRGVSDVFVNLARRNQVLLHRQLTLLDSMERRTEDTEELADLFRLDHLTTRMRRHAEGLVILSGASPSRQWRKPVQLMDVVRAAVAEVEDYERVEVRRLPRIGVGGPAVADLTHLIAELLENATVFSPPHTAVQVLGERVANGFTLEIHDRGLGIAPDALLDANLRLAETPEFELSDTDRLGLFVVSRLAQRQNVRVSLQPSPYGGTTAVIFIPVALLTDAPDSDAPDTDGTDAGSGIDGAGFRSDRRSVHRPGPRSGLAPVPTAGRTPVSVIDGPVELEPPVDPLTFDDTADLDDEDSAPGGIFRNRAVAPAPDQHQQTPDEGAAPQSATRPAGPAGLPRRRKPGQPTLVSDHGRRVDIPAPPRTDPLRREPPRSKPQRTDTPPTDTPPTDTPRAEPSRIEPRRAGLPQRVPRRTEPSRTDPSQPGPPRTGPPVAGPGGLPRRVRQANLAPQLRGVPAAEPATADDDERDADEVRSRMASLQRGWQRGRRDNAAQDSAESAAVGTGPAGTAPGTTSEGTGR